ncbi:alpha/beta hydrolase [Paraglaciecola aquimarina]|uniref:Alpha/beta hydrolase n=1 Tax=Paraglaciecola aquimarina TaxID=1235557 RepID=A0ABU3SSR9_9ALTE|nr:alpha/beta hydrolase [Paraglaciecola aquimarina]MDU0353068.1 alpha/beta hydrolase [Paraglaciecola aquimarina]
MFRSVYFLLIFGWVSSALANQALQKPVAEALVPLPSHWQQLHIDNPVFGGQVHVIETGERQNKTLILVHGLGYSGLRDWLDVIASLEADYHIVALDLPGFGESDSTSLQLAPERYADLLKWLIPQFTKQKVTVIGHSMGGAISLRFTATYPNMVEKLIMVDTAGVLHRSAFVRHMTQMPRRYEWLANYQKNFSIVDEAVNQFNRIVNQVSGSVLRELDKLPDPTQVLIDNKLAQQYAYKDRPTLNAAIGLINEDFSSAINQFTTPTHIIWGEFDQVAPLRTGQLLAYQLENAQLHVVKDAGHVPMKDKTRDFMQKLTFALQQPPIPADKYLAKYSAEKEDLFCQNQTDKSYSGEYRNVYILGCRYITLDKLSARNLIIKNSEVTMSEVNLNSNGTAVKIEKSFVTMTNVNLHGATAIQLEGSTLDVAGAKMQSSANTINVIADSLIYLSVSEKEQAGYKQFLHGISQGDAFRLK